MDGSNILNERLQKLNELKSLLKEFDNKLAALTKDLNWDYKNLLEENASNMVTCSINKQHRVPVSKVEIHEQKCLLHHQGYLDNDKFFSEHSGVGSFISLTSEDLQSLTRDINSTVVLFARFLLILMEINLIHFVKVISTSENKTLREVPQTSANLDQNFSREEKLAIYDYVIANTQKQNSYSDLWMQPTAKPEEKKEMTPWEIAAAERDAKRRRASYRNKVHTNRKTHTEILREVIESQMEALKEENTTEKTEEKMEIHKTSYHKSSHESSDKNRYHESYGGRTKDGKDKRRSHEKHSKHREHKRSPTDTGSHIKFRSRSYDKFRKYKNYEGRSHFHRSISGPVIISKFSLKQKSTVVPPKNFDFQYSDFAPKYPIYRSLS